jgi:hypothetical protein
MEHILSQPLLTEEGFVNEACMNELSAAIANIPPTHERLSNDIEWSAKIYTCYRDITAAFGYVLIAQFQDTDQFAEQLEKPPPFAPGLEEMVGYLTACIRPEFDRLGYKCISLCEINKMCWDILGDSKRFNSWNTKECLGSHWLDLNALLHNVCLIIRDNRRKYNIDWKLFRDDKESTK